MGGGVWGRGGGLLGEGFGGGEGGYWGRGLGQEGVGKEGGQGDNIEDTGVHYCSLLKSLILTL